MKPAFVLLCTLVLGGCGIAQRIEAEQHAKEVAERPWRPRPISARRFGKNGRAPISSRIGTHAIGLAHAVSQGNAKLALGGLS